MRPLPTPEEMARADQATIEGGTPADILMDRAGRAVARVCIDVLGRRYGGRVAVVCGKGSNGGDGFVAARVLRREGIAVRCLCVTDPAGLKGAAATHARRMRSDRIPLETFEEHALRGADVIVDAIFGTGFEGRAEGTAATAIEALNAHGAPIVAVDIPSGVNGSTGHIDGPAVRATVTVAMAAQKIGTAVPPGSLHAGRVEVADIGIPVDGARASMPDEVDVAAALPRRAAEAHKRSVGSVALIAGASGMSGAALLAARGATRMGAGYVTLGCTADVDRAKAGLLPEVLSEVVSDEEVIGPDALKRFKDVLGRADCVGIGPGLGTGERQRALVSEALGVIDAPIVLDADGLNVLVGDPSPLAQRPAPTVITPHPGELARLLGSSPSDERVAAARRAAEELGCVVVLKGYRTVIAEASGRVVVNPTGGPELATAGTGDVLTGAVAATLAAGADPFEAAWATVFVHGRAGSIAGARPLAWDVAEALPRAVATVVEGTTL